MKRILCSIALVVAVCFVALGTASAGNLSIGHGRYNPTDINAQVPFPTAGDAYCSATNGCGTIPSGGQTAYMWTAGDYVISSVFTGTGITSATDLTANFNFQDFLGGGNNELVYIYLNNVAVAQFTAPDCNYCGSYLNVTGTVNFSDIAPSNGGYQLEMVLQNTIPGGGGSIAFADGGLFTISGTSSVPEPASVATLLGFGLFNLAAVLYFRRTVNGHAS